MKVGDLGCARLVAPGAVGFSGALGSSAGASGSSALPPAEALSAGTAQYAAPELLNPDLRAGGTGAAVTGELALAADVYSFGVVLWEAAERRRPFEGQSATAVQASWLAAPHAARLPRVRAPEGLPPAEARAARGLADLAEDCTRLDPRGRPAFGEVLRRLRALADAA
jgi:serine/threonine protein kinase